MPITLYIKGNPWDNKEILIGQQSPFNKEWFEKGVLYKKDIIGIDNNVLPLWVIKIRYHINGINLLFIWV